MQLDGEPALDVLLRDLKISLDQPEPALRTIRATLVGLMRPAEQGGATDDAVAIGRSGNFGSDVLVRHIIGLDPARRAVAVYDAYLEAPHLDHFFLVDEVVHIGRIHIAVNRLYFFSLKNI